MTPRTRRWATALLLTSLVTVGCDDHDRAQDAACDPGGKRAAALAAESALMSAPPGFKRVDAGLDTSTYDQFSTRKCDDVFLVFTLTPVPDAAVALKALERQLVANGWVGVLVDTHVNAISASKVIDGAKATLRGNVIATEHNLRVGVSLAPVVEHPPP